jgi:Xaa-Pro aminopeptidase
MTSRNERDARATRNRRQQALADLAAQAGLDMLLVFGRGAIGQHGYLRYLTGYCPIIRMALAVVRPDAPVRLLVTSASDEVLAADYLPPEDIALLPPGEAPLAVQIARAVEAFSPGGDHARIGIVGLESIVPADLAAGLAAAMPQVTWVGATALAQQAKAIKSADEIAALREAATMADDALAALVDALADPDCTLAAAAGQAAAHLTRCGASDMLIYASLGPHFLHRPACVPLPEDRLATVFVEASTADGYWVELARLIARGTPTPTQAQLADDGLALMDAAQHSLRPGAIGGNVAAVLSTQIASFGHSSGLWLGHGVGLDDHDLPVIGPGDDTRIEAGMVVAIHPHLIDANGEAGSSLGDTFLIDAEETTALSRWPRAIIQV